MGDQNYSCMHFHGTMEKAQFPYLIQMEILNGSIQLLMVTIITAIRLSIYKLTHLQIWLLLRVVGTILTTIELYLRVPHLILFLQVKLLEILHLVLANYTDFILRIRIMLSL